MSKALISIVLLLSFLNFTLSIVTKSYTKLAYTFEGSKGGSWTQTWWFVWVECEESQYGVGAISNYNIVYDYNPKKTSSQPNLIFTASISYKCIYNDIIQNPTIYKGGENYDTPIIQGQYIDKSTEKKSCSTKFINCKPGKMECDIDYALQRFILRKEGSYTYYHDYRCVAVKSTFEHGNLQYTAYGKSINDYSDIANWIALSNVHIPENARNALKGIEFGFSNKQTSNVYFTTSARYGYMYITLREITPVKQKYLDDAKELRDKYATV